MEEYFDNVTLYFNIDYKDKEDAKKCKLRWNKDKKLWYAVHNYTNNNKNCFGELEQLTKYNIHLDHIKHKHDGYNDCEYDEICTKYEKLLRKYRFQHYK